MERYKNLGGDSGISAYEISDDSITVQFRDGAVYLYTYRSAGSANIEKMKLLAVAGRGLNSHIKRYVNKGYESKLRQEMAHFLLNTPLEIQEDDRRNSRA